MKTTFALAILFYFACFSAIAQTYPELDEGFRLKQLEPPTGKIRMVLDTDTYNEVDDQFALAYAVLSPGKIELEAVYAAPFKNSRSTSAGDGMEKSYQEILRLLKFMGKSSDGFAFRGSDSYLNDVSKPIESDAAKDLIRKAMASSPEDPLYVVPVGCITNIASAILLEPEIIKNIVVVWLGGTALTGRTRENSTWCRMYWLHRWFLIRVFLLLSCQHARSSPIFIQPFLSSSITWRVKMNFVITSMTLLLNTVMAGKPGRR